MSHTQLRDLALWAPSCHRATTPIRFIVQVYIGVATLG